MSFLSSFSTALRTHSAPLNARLGAQVQTPTDTIDKLVERIQTSPSVDDRRTAVLGLKGCCREFKEVRPHTRRRRKRQMEMNGRLESLLDDFCPSIVHPRFARDARHRSSCGIIGSGNPIISLSDRGTAIRRAARCRYRQSRTRDLDGRVRGRGKGRFRSNLNLFRVAYWMLTPRP